MVVYPSAVTLAKQVFDSLGVLVVTSHRFLGGFLGDVQARHHFAQKKIDQWVTDIYNLSKMATPQPQVAYATFTT